MHFNIILLFADLNNYNILNLLQTVLNIYIYILKEYEQNKNKINKKVMLKNRCF